MVIGDFTIDTHMRTATLSGAPLRRKLEIAAAGQHHLRTEPSIVYRFDPTPATIR
jgi:hypothetical protein